MRIKVFTLLVLAIALRKCSAAPSGGELQLRSGQKTNIQESSDEYDEDVEDLHDLLLAMSKTRENGSLPATSNIDSSSEETADEEAKTDSDSLPAKDTSSDLPDFHDTPRDMAEYIFWTGNRKSVTGAVEDFINQGLMNQQEATDFLEQVQGHLEDIQEKYGARDSGIKKASPHTASKAAGEIIVTNINLKEKLPKRPAAEKVKKDQPIKKNVSNSTKENGDDEAGLEMIIYQLSQILFSQSLQGGHSSAQKSLEKFAEFLEKGSEDGKLSPQLQKKILNLLLTSLSDAMTEHTDAKQLERELTSVK